MPASRSNNSIERLDERVGDLGELRFLALNSNKLSSLPASIGRLGRCTRLLLNGNRLAALPATLAQLCALEHLNLANNDISRAGVPDELGAHWVRSSHITTVPPLAVDSAVRAMLEGASAIAPTSGDAQDSPPCDVILEGNPLSKNSVFLTEADMSQSVAIWKKQKR